MEENNWRELALSGAVGEDLSLQVIFDLRDDKKGEELQSSEKEKALWRCNHKYKH